MTSRLAKLTHKRMLFQRKENKPPDGWNTIVRNKQNKVNWKSDRFSGGTRYPRIEPELRPVSPALATKECEASFYPIWSNIACTILVTSCECKRSASTLRCLNNYMKASMGKSRLSRLALLHIHSQTTVNLDLPWSGSRYLYAATSQENTTGKPSVTVPLQYCSVIIEKKNKETS